MRPRPTTILLIAGLGIVLYGYPGLLSYDSAFQLDQGRRWDLGDWHPPAMAVLWRAVEQVVAGPFGMLLIQTTGLVIGIYALLRVELAARRASIVTLAICWFPPVIAVMGVIWKDTQMIAFALLGFAGLLSTEPRRHAAALTAGGKPLPSTEPRRHAAALTAGGKPLPSTEPRRPHVRWLALGALVIAGAMRHNAFAATFAPVVLLWGRETVPRLRRYATSVATWLAITVASFGINAALTTEHEHLWSSTLAVTDIVGTLRWAPASSDAELRELLTGTPLKVDHDIAAAIRKHYEPRGYAIYYQFDPPLDMPGTDAERDAVARAWRRTVLGHPLAYLHHRWVVFERVIELGHRPVVPPLTFTFTYEGDPSLAKRLGQDGSPSLVQAAWFAVVRAVAIWYAPIIYLVVALILLPLARRSRVALAILLSGLGYEASLVFLAPTPDYRYSHYLIVTTLVASVMVFVQRWRLPAHGVRAQRTPKSAPRTTGEALERLPVRT